MFEWKKYYSFLCRIFMTATAIRLAATMIRTAPMIHDQGNPGLPEESSGPGTTGVSDAETGRIPLPAVSTGVGVAVSPGVAGTDVGSVTTVFVAVGVTVDWVVVDG
jgi:hypothetical protein